MLTTCEDLFTQIERPKPDYDGQVFSNSRNNYIPYRRPSNGGQQKNTERTIEMTSTEQQAAPSTGGSTGGDNAYTYSRWMTGTKEAANKNKTQRFVAIAMPAVLMLAAVSYVISLMLKNSTGNTVVIVVLVIAAIGFTVQSARILTRTPKDDGMLAISHDQLTAMRQDLNITTLVMNPLVKITEDQLFDPNSYDFNEAVIQGISFNPSAANKSYKIYGSFIDRQSGKPVRGLFEIGVQANGDKIRLFITNPLVPAPSSIDARNLDSYKSPDADYENLTMILR